MFKFILKIIEQLFQERGKDVADKTPVVVQEDLVETVDEAVTVVKVEFEENILYVDIEIGLNVRKTPGVKTDNKIDLLKFGEEVKVIEKGEDGWCRIRYGKNKEGWVSSQYLTEENPKTSTSEIKKKLSNDVPVFRIGGKNLSNDENTKRLRKIINQQFGHTEESGVSLQCVEYVHYMVKDKNGVDIKWPQDRPRHGGMWSSIFQKNNLYKVLNEPVLHSAMSFANPSFNNPYGHVAFVDVIFDDGSIRISEANWPRNGIYNERILSKQQWSQEKWGAKFIDFSV